MTGLPPSSTLLARIADGRTDLVFDLIAAGESATLQDSHGVSLMQHCAYYGDVSAIRFLLTHGATLDALGADLGLADACFHGHWRLAQFLLENGADVNRADPATGETPLHAALCTTERLAHNRVLQVLLAHRADPNRATRPGAETGAFMRDVRTRGEAPLHRAAAFGDEQAIRMLLDAGAKLDVTDAYGESPLSWASWHLRPTPILQLLCYGDFRVNPARTSMDAYLQGQPHT